MKKETNGQRIFKKDRIINVYYKHVQTTDRRNLLFNVLRIKKPSIIAWKNKYVDDRGNVWIILITYVLYIIIISLDKERRIFFHDFYWTLP